MTQWHEYSYLAETCGNTHCKYFTINGCIHPYVKDCKNASLYWPWQLDYDNNLEEQCNENQSNSKI